MALLGLVEPMTPHWLREMVSHALRPGIGAVGAKLYDPAGAIAHAGLVLGLGAVAGRIYRGALKSRARTIARLFTVQNYTAVTGACLAARREVIEQVGGSTWSTFHPPTSTSTFVSVYARSAIARYGPRTPSCSGWTLTRGATPGPTIPPGGGPSSNRRTTWCRAGATRSGPIPNYNPNLSLKPAGADGSGSATEAFGALGGRRLMHRRLRRPQQLQRSQVHHRPDREHPAPELHRVAALSARRRLHRRNSPDRGAARRGRPADHAGAGPEGKPGAGAGASACSWQQASKSGARYLALADQDDGRRCPDKLERELALLRRREGELGDAIPLLVHSDLTVVDEGLDVIAPSYLAFERQRPLSEGALRKLLIQTLRHRAYHARQPGPPPVFLTVSRGCHARLVARALRRRDGRGVVSA